MDKNALSRYLTAVTMQVEKLAPFRINYIASVTGAKSYLEIGVREGATFFNISLENKVGVDPAFLFEPQDHICEGVSFCPLTSDEFFSLLTAGEGKKNIITSNNYPLPQTFDIIFIDGLHTFEQSLRDFENSLSYAHDQTIWLIDDTVPSDPFSAVPNMELSFKLRALSGVDGTPWHGDVYKTVLAIHDRYPEFSYCTLMGGNPQTVVWKSRANKRKSFFNSWNDINFFSYFDMLSNAWLWAPTTDQQFPSLFLHKKELVPATNEEAQRMLIYKQLTTTRESILRDELHGLAAHLNIVRHRA